MKILVANLGSTSFKYRLFDMTDERAPRGLVPLEMRRIPKDVPLADWEMLAYQIFIFAESMIDAKLY